MNYTEVTIECKNTDETCDRLTALGVDGFVIENEDDFKAFLENNRQYWDYVDSSLEESYKGVSRVKFYVEDNEDGARLLDAVKAEFEVKTAPVCDADWENNWKEYYKPLEIGEKFLVVPEWIDCAEVGRVPLRQRYPRHRRYRSRQRFLHRLRYRPQSARHRHGKRGSQRYWQRQNEGLRR